ncbi:MAG: phospholipase [Bacteroidetes bacterium]|nr:phospholipase [Bacteroidota bacterium]
MSAGKSKNENYGYIAGNSIRLIRGGMEYFQLLEKLINDARETVHLQTYIYEDDETGRKIGQALMQAAQRNVQVYLVADGYASQVMSNAFIKTLIEAGIHFRFFEPIFKSKYYYFGRRLHHKLAVIDTRYAIVGGINISNNYNDLPGKPAWLDFALYAEGAVAKQLCVLCWKTWKGYPAKMGLTPCEEKEILFDIKPEEDCLVRMRRNDWVRRKNEVSKSYQEIFRQANQEIIIISSYFLPGKEFRKNIKEAVQRGVKVKLVLASTSDVMIAKQAERHMYQWLFKNNIEIYEYRPAVLHGKMAICDDQWFTLGSYNVNNISAFASIELNLDVQNEKITTSAKQIIETIIQKDCIRITEKKFNASNHFLRRLWQETCYEFVRMLFYCFTFYFKQKE